MMNNIKIYILSHGNICVEYYIYFRYMAGEELAKYLIPIPLKSNMSRDDYLKNIYAEYNKECFPVFLTDIPGGTPDILAKMIVKKEGKGVVISGVNIPMIVNLIKIKDFDNKQALIDKLIEAGKNGIKKFYIQD